MLHIPSIPKISRAWLVLQKHKYSMWLMYVQEAFYYQLPTQQMLRQALRQGSEIVSPPAVIIILRVH